MFDRRGWWRVAGALALAGVAGMVSAQAPATAAPVKVGFVYVSPIGDAGWTFQHDQGRKQMEAALGNKVQTKFVENVAEGPDAERVIREMAQNGTDIIFTTSFGYMNPTEKVAKQFPKVKFAHATGYKSGPNFATTTRASTKAVISTASSPAR
jgi:simple sugar transport system substrate-binding protein